MTDLTIRIARADDLDAVSALLKASYEQLLTPHYPQAQLAAALPYMIRARPELLTSGTYFVGICHSVGTVIGCGGWTPQSPRGGDTAGRGHIRHFATAPDRVRTGVGRAILQRCIREMRAAGLREAECLSTLMAEPFYGREGFRSVAREAVRIGGEVSFPAVRMLLPL